VEPRWTQTERDDQEDECGKIAGWLAQRAGGCRLSVVGTSQTSLVTTSISHIPGPLSIPIA
jgi:hypothetical protein